MKKIKIINSDGKSTKTFEKEINKLLAKGWKLKGGIFISTGMNQLLIK